jgi:WD40 repeat protein
MSPGIQIMFVWIPFFHFLSSILFFGQATRLVTSSEDDMSPIIMVWDLRNARAPERILTGHEKGVLSLSWCKQDPDLLLSCGKDNKVLGWNPQTSEIIGEVCTVIYSKRIRPLIPG